jgi:hypothetical protein
MESLKGGFINFFMARDALKKLVFFDFTKRSKDKILK